RRRCADGTLPAIRLGTDYRVQWADVLAVLQHRPAVATPGQAKGKATEDLLGLLDAWVVHLRCVRGLAPTTIVLYQGLYRTYLRRLAAAGYPAVGPASLFERQSLAAVFAKLPPRSFNTRQNTHI